MGAAADDVEKEAGSDEEDSDSGLESSDGTASDEEDARMSMAPRRSAQRQRHKTWPPPPLGGIGRPVSAQPSSRKRAASGTPGSDQASPSSCAFFCLPRAASAPHPHTRNGMLASTFRRRRRGFPEGCLTGQLHPTAS